MFLDSLASHIADHAILIFDNIDNVTCECFSDVLIEEAAGGSTVAEIFKLRGEGFFRDNEVSHH